MKTREAVTFKVYTNNSCNLNKCFKAKKPVSCLKLRMMNLIAYVF
jgi:hypothetical protein